MKNRAAEKLAVKTNVAFCRFVLGGVLLITGFSAFAGEQQIDLNWLKVVAFAAHQTEYSGVFVYQYGNRVETSRITHIAEPDSEFEKLERLDGPKHEIVRHHGHVWCYINQKMVQVDSKQAHGQFPDLLSEQISALSENYWVKDAGVERVAGYNAQTIMFKPKDKLRYAHKIWAHTDSGLILKAAVLDDKNQLVEQYAFTQLQIGGGIDRSWVKQSASDNAGSLPASPEPLKGGTPVNSGWVADSLPPGFKKSMEIQRPMRGRVSPVTQLVFSDGLSAISIFIEPDNSDEGSGSGLFSRGAVNLYSKVMNQYLFTVVGEVPPRTVMQVLDSVRYNGK
jgi:sigma-E factor negative regulatory protein RseB